MSHLKVIFEIVPVSPVITSITCDFTFHMR